MAHRGPSFFISSMLYIGIPECDLNNQMDFAKKKADEYSRKDERNAPPATCHRPDACHAPRYDVHSANISANALSYFFQRATDFVWTGCLTCRELAV